MRTTNNRGFKYFQLKVFFSYQGLFEKSETMYLLLHFFYFDNNQFENDNKRAPRPNKPDKSSIIIVSKNKNLVFAAF